MNKLFLSSQVQDYEKAYFDQGNLDKDLMLKAAEITAEYIIKNTDNKKFICICGPGNNGGDGCYVGIYLSNKGFDVKIVEALEAKTKSSLCMEAFNEAHSGDLVYQISILNNIDTDEVIVDAIFGTNLKGALDQNMVDLITIINSYKEIFSIDIPSGIHPDTGVPCEAYVEANKTISFIGRKLGLSLNEGKISSGEKHFHSLNLEMEKDIKEIAKSYQFIDVKDLLIQRSPVSHKGNHGRLMVIGGDDNMGGAAILASETALKSGSGLVSLLTQKIHLKASLIRNPEVMAIDSDSHEELVAAMSNQDVFVCGPGLSSSSWSKSMLTKLINHLNKNMGAVVFDAGALRILAKDFLSTHNIKSSIVLTPHPGEAADLLGITIKEVQLDRINAAKKIATQYKATVILKGAGSIVTDGSEVYICDEGGPELATGGTGDILAGLVGSLIAQGLSANNASLLAVATHGLAGKEFKDICGENGLAASELIPLIRKILNNK